MTIYVHPPVICSSEKAGRRRKKTYHNTRKSTGPLPPPLHLITILLSHQTLLPLPLYPWASRSQLNKQVRHNDRKPATTATEELKVGAAGGGGRVRAGRTHQGPLNAPRQVAKLVSCFSSPPLYEWNGQELRPAQLLSWRSLVRLAF